MASPRAIAAARRWRPKRERGVRLRGRRGRSSLLACDGRKVRRLETPGDRYVRHTLAITELVIRLHEATGRGELDLIALQAEPACWRVFTGPARTRVTVKPDLYVNLGAGDYEDRWFIEVDLATEARGTLQSKAKRYVSHLRSGAEGRVYPRVLWVVPDDHRLERVQDALGALPVEYQRLFSYITFDHAVGFLAREARV